MRTDGDAADGAARLAADDAEEAEQHYDEAADGEHLTGNESRVIEIHSGARVGDAALGRGEGFEDVAGALELIEAGRVGIGGAMDAARDDLAVELGFLPADDPVADSEEDQRKAEHDAPVAIDIRNFHRSVTKGYGSLEIKTTPAGKVVHR
jgi:hypothetical protein